MRLVIDRFAYKHTRNIIIIIKYRLWVVAYKI